MEEFPCKPTPDCPLYGNCYTDVHHKYYPRHKYRGKFLRAFRNLDENKEKTCRARHEEIHATEPVPKKPTQDEMWIALGKAAVLSNEVVSPTPAQERLEHARELMDRVLGFEV